MPIKQLDERVRMLPRLGKIKLGEIVSKDGVKYPRALDYFVCPPEVQAVYGEKPKKLEILLPHEEIDITFPHWYKLYGKQRGLICKGDGKAAQWKQKDGTYVERECTCQLFDEGKCKYIGTFNFILPKVKGFGVHQIVTSSYYSICNILDYLEMLISTLGKISFIPLFLEVKMEEFNPTVNGKQVRTVNPILHLVLEESFESLAKKAKAGVLDKTIRLGLPGTVDLEKADSDDEIPEELYPNIMNQGDVQATKESPPKSESKSKLAIEIDQMLNQLKYSHEEKMQLWKKYPEPAKLRKILGCIEEIRKMFGELSYPLEAQKKVWDKYPDPEILCRKLKEFTGSPEVNSTEQESGPESNPEPEQPTQEEDIPGHDPIEIDETQTIPLF